MAAPITSLTDLVTLVEREPFYVVIRKLTAVTKRRKTANRIMGDPKDRKQNVWWTWVEQKGEHRVRLVAEVADLLWAIPIARRSFEHEIKQSRTITLLDRAMEHKMDPAASWLVQQGCWFGTQTVAFTGTIRLHIPNAVRLICDAHKNAERILGQYLLRELVRIIKGFFHEWS